MNTEKKIHMQPHQDCFSIKECKLRINKYSNALYIKHNLPAWPTFQNWVIYVMAFCIKSNEAMAGSDPHGVFSMTVISL